MNYNRVVPRDLFNESKLLKCLGFISVRILDAELLKYGAFDNLTQSTIGFIVANNESGDIFCVNYKVYVRPKVFGRKEGDEVEEEDFPLNLYSKLNSKENFPLICETFEGEPLYVFESDGKFTKEFISYLKRLYLFKG